MAFTSLKLGTAEARLHNPAEDNTVETSSAACGVSITDKQAGFSSNEVGDSRENLAAPRNKVSGKRVGQDQKIQHFCLPTRGLFRAFAYPVYAGGYRLCFSRT